MNWQAMQWMLGLVISATLAVAEEPAGKLEPIQVGQPQKIEVFPPSIKLSNSLDPMRIVVTGLYSDGLVQDLTRGAEIQSSNPAVAEIANGLLRAKGDGSAEVVVKAGGQEARIPVTVTNGAQPRPRSFEFDALVAVSKNGCNSGACHGSPSGKGGFRLSLRAFDPKLDELTLVHEDFGRRTNPLNPEESLLLLKPLMRVPHGGGMRMRAQDPAFLALRDWVREGCRIDPPDSPRCVKLEVYPPSGRVLKRPAHTQQLAVLAHFSDGTVRDVSEMAVFSSSDEQVASVSSTGFVVGQERGEAAILVRYLEHIESCFLTFVRDVDGFTWKDPPRNNYVDEFIHQKLQQLKFLPSGTCTDEEFIRRVYLDVIGIVPTIQETTEFLADSAPDKRARLIDRLLDRPEFAKFWALKWGDLLRLTTKQVGSDGVYKYHRWVERALADNMPYDEFARQLLTSVGSTLSNPPANFYRTAGDANDCVETISQIFLGARLQCAKCHNHPFERWTQDNYYGMAAFFNRVQRKKTARPDELVVYVSQSGEVTQPRTGKQMKPWLPAQGDVENAAVDDRRSLFAEWLTRPDNPFFARIEVNRLWGQLFGRGIVEPIDDFRDSNPPSNGPLLDALAKDFADHKFDRKHILRTILNSRTYQTSYETNDFNKDDVKYFSHFQPRLLSAEQLLDAICQTTSIPEQFGPLPAGTKATQLPAPDIVKHEFLKIFGQPERQTVCACERTSESNLGMAIQFFNGPLIYNKLRDENNRFRKLVNDGKSDPEIVKQLYLAAVNRQPNENELSASLQHIATKDQQIAARNAELATGIAGMNQQIATVRAGFENKLREQKLGTVPEVLRGDLVAALAVEDGKRTEVQKYLAEKLGPMVAVTADEVTAALDDAAKKQIADAQTKIAELDKQKQQPGARRVEALEDVCWALLNTNEFLFQH
jgi:hypothetical protein